MKTMRFLCTLSILAISVLNLSGCGQTGALYLPTPPAKPAPAPVSPSEVQP